jgi:hypothetical protein
VYAYRHPPVSLSRSWRSGDRGGHSTGSLLPMYQSQYPSVPDFSDTLYFETEHCNIYDTLYFIWAVVTPSFKLFLDVIWRSCSYTTTSSEQFNCELWFCSEICCKVRWSWRPLLWVTLPNVPIRVTVGSRLFGHLCYESEHCTIVHYYTLFEQFSCRSANCSTSSSSEKFNREMILQWYLLQGQLLGTAGSPCPVKAPSISLIGL